ncbi:unnamed protein product [Ceratitis capitata]|uniref:(Mediterranean fruit fly) hypothetical protein n=1 Tax=Ceratitis capitata TaxID=7213 RepID=A0A811VM62_CERCA|nr:unnamed protein product [Ceratitis capitata]
MPPSNGGTKGATIQTDGRASSSLEADLFYVHEGAINTYAMHFTVPVPADVHDLEFSWQSLTTYPLPYTITIDYEQEQSALAAPTLSIPDRGYVPQQIETFLVHLPCTGDGNKEVPLVVNMLVSGPPRTNDTKLHFKRNKICLKGLFPAPNQSAAPAQAPSPGHTLLGAAACALGLVLVFSLIASAMYVRARKQIRQDSLHTSFTTAAYGSHQNVFIRLDPLGRPPSANSGSYATIASLNKYPSESKKSCNIFDRFRSSTPTPSPYATALLPVGGDHQIGDTIYSKPESICPSRISYYASSQLTQKIKFLNSNNDYGGMSDEFEYQHDFIISHFISLICHATQHQQQQQQKCRPTTASN